jgi:hypothetical protein
MATTEYVRREWGAPCDPKQCVEYVRELLHYTDARPESTERPLNYTQLQLEVQAAMAADDLAMSRDVADYYSNTFSEIQEHMERRFKLLPVGDQAVNARERAKAAALERANA